MRNQGKTYEQILHNLVNASFGYRVIQIFLTENDVRNAITLAKSLMITDFIRDDVVVDKNTITYNGGGYLKIMTLEEYKKEFDVDSISRCL